MFKFILNLNNISFLLILKVENNNYKMPTLYPNFFYGLSANIFEYPVFIETGTQTGATVFGLLDLFKQLHTIELSQHWYNKATEFFKQRYNDKKDKITFHLGDSNSVLKTLLPEIKEPVIFFLDAHYSGGDTARGNVDVPLYEELNTINSLLVDKAVIIIDDARLFENKQEEGWTNITSTNILKVLENRLEKFYYLPSELSNQDRLVIHITKKN
jgi:hypothetical protein